MSASLFRRFQLAAMLVLVLAVSVLLYERAQAIVPVDSTVTPGSIHTISKLLTGGTGVTTLISNSSGRNFILTDVSVALYSPPESGSGNASTDRIELIRQYGSISSTVDLTSFVHTGGTRMNSVFDATHTKNFGTGIVIANTATLSARVLRNGTGSHRQYLVLLHGYFQ